MEKKRELHKTMQCAVSCSPFPLCVHVVPIFILVAVRVTLLIHVVTVIVNTIIGLLAHQYLACVRGGWGGGS